ncbi:MAG: NifU family protein [Alicyclobacillus sp.]|nr:NifU family protein [Alicyclobacillus sp.]
MGVFVVSVSATVIERIQSALEEIREAIQMDGGDVEFVSYDESSKTVYVSLTGSCVGCPASVMTLKMGVERAIRQQVPEVEHVEAY